LANMRGIEVFTFPWPGPGNSEGPVDPDEWTDSRKVRAPEPVDLEVLETPLATTSPWPGPGDSEG
jgi:hypothetical protein